MKVKFDFKILNVIEENSVKSYSVQCSSENFRRVIKARYDGSVYIPDYHQQLWNIPSHERTFLDIQLADFIIKNEKRKV